MNSEQDYKVSWFVHAKIALIISTTATKNNDADKVVNTHQTNFVTKLKFWQQKPRFQSFQTRLDPVRQVSVSQLSPLLTLCILLSCQPRVIATSCFVNKAFRDLESIDHLCIDPIRRIGLVHKWPFDSRKLKWSVQVNVLLNNCKHNITSLSPLVGTTVMDSYFGFDTINLGWLIVYIHCIHLGVTAPV